MPSAMPFPNTAPSDHVARSRQRALRPGRWLLILLLGLSAVSCRPAAPPTPPTPGSSPATPSLTVHPQRIVSLVPSATELIYEVGAGQTLVGVTINDDYPPAVASLPRVGDQTIDPERLLELRPDLVVLDTEFNRDQTQLERLRLPVLALRSQRLSDIADNMELLGQRLGRSRDGRAAAQRFRQALAEVPRVARPQKVLIEVWGSPLMTVGAQTLPDDLLNQLGLTNVYADQNGYFQVDPEDVVRRQPELIILPGQPGQSSVAAELLTRAGVPVQVITLDGDLFTSPTPRVVQGLRLINDQLSAGSPWQTE
jgi:iron complex transport system substrate-binding protein